MQGNDALNAVLPVIGALEKLGVPYVRLCSPVPRTASLGRPLTPIVADLNSQHVAGLVEALQSEYYISAAMIREAIARRSCFNLIHLATRPSRSMFSSSRRGPTIAPCWIARRSGRSTPPRRSRSVLRAGGDGVSQLGMDRLGDEVSDRQWRDISAS